MRVWMAQSLTSPAVFANITRSSGTMAVSLSEMIKIIFFFGNAHCWTIYLLSQTPGVKTDHRKDNFDRVR